MNMISREAVVNRVQTIREIKNATENYTTICSDMLYYDRARDFSKEKKKDGRPVVLTSSGPSLNEAIPFLKTCNMDIICHFRQARTLYEHGIIPKYIVAVDPRATALHFVDMSAWNKLDTTLITQPGVHSSVIHNWPNKYLLFRTQTGDTDSFQRYYLNVMYSVMTTPIEEYMTGSFEAEPMITTELPIFSNTPSLQFIIAHLLGYGIIHLVGFDFKTGNGLRRFTEIHEGIVKDYPINKPGDETDETLLHQKTMFLCALRMFPHNCRIYGDTSITELPHENIEKLSKTKNRKEHFNRKKVIKNMDVHLFRNKIAVIEHKDHTCTFMEFKNTEWIIQKIHEKANTYICELCGHQIVTKKQPSLKCEKCLTGKMHLMNEIDVNKNINRIRTIEILSK